MRGHDEQTSHMFSYLSPEQRVPADHPLRAIRTLTDHALRALSPTSYHRRGLRPPLRSIEVLKPGTSGMPTLVGSTTYGECKTFDR